MYLLLILLTPKPKHARVFREFETAYSRCVSTTHPYIYRIVEGIYVTKVNTQIRPWELKGPRGTRPLPADYAMKRVLTASVNNNTIIL